MQSGCQSMCSSCSSIQSSASSVSCLCRQPMVVVTNQAYCYSLNTPVCWLVDFYLCCWKEFKLWMPCLLRLKFSYTGLTLSVFHVLKFYLHLICIWPVVHSSFMRHAQGRNENKRIAYEQALMHCSRSKVDEQSFERWVRKRTACFACRWLCLYHRQWEPACRLEMECQCLKWKTLQNYLEGFCLYQKSFHQDMNSN